MSKCIFSLGVCNLSNSRSDTGKDADAGAFIRLSDKANHWSKLCIRIRSKSETFAYLCEISFATRVSAPPTSSVGDETRQKWISSEHRLRWKAIAFRKGLASRRFNRQHKISLQTLWISMIFGESFDERWIKALTIHWRQTEFCWWKELVSPPKTSSSVESFCFDIQIVTTLSRVCNREVDNDWFCCMWKVFQLTTQSLVKLVCESCESLINLFWSSWFPGIKCVNIFSELDVVFYKITPGNERNNFRSHFLSSFVSAFHEWNSCHRKCLRIHFVRIKKWIISAC